MKFKFLKKFLLFSALAAGFICFYYSCKTTPVASEREPYGQIEVISNPERAEIYLDGSFTEHYTNYTLHYVPVGSHTITLQKICYKDLVKTIDVQENRKTIMNVTLEREIPEGENTVSGTVFYSTTPLDGIKVELFEDLSGPLLQSTWTKNGLYSFSSVFPGRHRIKAYPPTDEYVGERDWTLNLGACDLEIDF